MNNNNFNINKQYLELRISFFSLFKIVFLLAGLWLLFMVKDIIFILFVSIFIAALINNGIKKFQKYLKYRFLIVSIFYLFFLVLITAILLVLIPGLLQQISELHHLWPAYSEKVLSLIPSNWRNDIFSVFDIENIDWQNTVGDVLLTIRTFFGGLFNLVIVLVLSFYMSLEEDALDKALDFFLPEKIYTKTADILNKIESRLSQWFEAQLILCLLMGILAYLGLTIFGVKYALVLALFAFLGEFVPYLGAIVSTFFAVFFALLQSPWIAMFILIWFLIMHQLESNVFVPNIMKKAVGLNPIITIIALLIGAELAGVLGAVLAIPIATSIGVIIDNLYNTENIHV